MRSLSFSKELVEFQKKNMIGLKRDFSECKEEWQILLKYVNIFLAKLIFSRR